MIDLRSKLTACIGACAALLISVSSGAAATTRPASDSNLPTLFIIGDSTVKNHKPLVGWGDAIAGFFDTTRIAIENDAIPGRSSRTFITEGRWQAVLDKLSKGDFVLMQFGHNDTKAAISAKRYSLAGLGEETEDWTNPATGEKTTIHTFGWYMRKMIGDTLAKGATPIVLSPVPRCKWSKGIIVRGENNHGPWAETTAQAMGVAFVDLNGLIADRYDAIGQQRIKSLYFPGDNTHTNLAGAKLNAACVVVGLSQLNDCPLRKYLRDDAAKMADELSPATVPAP